MGSFWTVMWLLPAAIVLLAGFVAVRGLRRPESGSEDER